MQQTILFRGCATALVTPFKGGKVDFDSLARLMEYQLEGGVKTVVLCGTTGEGATLSKAEKQSIFSFAASEYGNRATLIAGCGNADTADSVCLCRMAAASGVHGILAVTPYYVKPSNEGLFLHYKALSEASDLPVIAYTVPSRTGVGISPELWKRLSCLPGIAGLKDAGGDISRSASYLHESPKPLYSGNDDAILPLLSLGGRGCISVLSNLMPARVQSLCDAFWSGESAKAASLQLSFLPLIRALFSETNPIPVKWALHRLGFCKDEWRLPLCAPAKEVKSRLEGEMEALGLI